MKQGIRVMAAYFEYEDGDEKSFINERLLSACNYTLNINQLESDEHFKPHFKGLFKKAGDFASEKHYGVNGDTPK